MERNDTKDRRLAMRRQAQAERWDAARQRKWEEQEASRLLRLEGQQAKQEARMLQSQVRRDAKRAAQEAKVAARQQAKQGAKEQAQSDRRAVHGTLLDLITHLERMETMERRQAMEATAAAEIWGAARRQQWENHERVRLQLQMVTQRAAEAKATRTPGRGGGRRRPTFPGRKPRGAKIATAKIAKFTAAAQAIQPPPAAFEITAATCKFEDLAVEDFVQTYWEPDLTWYPAFVQDVSATAVKLFYPVDNTSEKLKKEEFQDGVVRRIAVRAGVDAPKPPWVVQEAARLNSAGARALRALPVKPEVLARFGTNQRDRGMAQIYLAVRYLGDGYGRNRAETFMKLPKKSEFPEYYELVDKPKSLNRVAKKLETGGYTKMDSKLGVAEFESDMTVVFPPRHSRS